MIKNVAQNLGQFTAGHICIKKGGLFQDFLTTMDKFNLVYTREQHREQEMEEEREKRKQERIVLNRQEGQRNVLLNCSSQLNQKSICPCFEYQ